MRHPGDLTETIHAVGVDNGGTWIRLKGVNARGRCVWSIQKPSPTVKKLPSFLKHHLKRFHGALRHLAVGSRGVWKPATRRSVKRALQGVAKHIVVTSDVEAAWMAAFAKAGIMVISGTGSIAYGRDGHGRAARAGGFGPEKGDEGSGFWIGREWLRKTSESRKKRVESRSERVRRIAQMASDVIRKAKEGDIRAQEVIQVAQDHLSDLVSSVATQMHWRGRICLSVGGGVFADTWFKRGFLKRLRKQGLIFKVIRARTDVAQALALSLLTTHSNLLSSSRSIMSHAAR